MPDDTYGDRDPFIEQTLEELGSGCYESAVKLGSDRKRSIEERRALVERTRMLLLALGYRLHGTSNGTLASPEQAAELADGDFATDGGFETLLRELEVHVKR
ncbi:MAG: hypothetical protein ACTHK2_19095 [Dokdonella sp.]|uniref:hypothetical protein n=1 Tax=Dokdonella sp. TaxID=2291710 RepID=UPI003F80D7B3